MSIKHLPHLKIQGSSEKRGWKKYKTEVVDDFMETTDAWMNSETIVACADI